MSMGSDSKSPPFHISGVVPSLAVKADMMPKRSETGIGALMPWADKLWMVTYPSHKSATGSGTGLFEIDDEFTLRKRPESLVGTHANRLVHVPSNQLFIGCYCIDVDGGVRVAASSWNTSVGESELRRMSDALPRRLRLPPGISPFLVRHFL
jgi:hypothetical protein